MPCAPVRTTPQFDDDQSRITRCHSVGDAQIHRTSFPLGNWKRKDKRCNWQAVCEEPKYRCELYSADDASPSTKTREAA